MRYGTAIITPKSASNVTQKAFLRSAAAHTEAGRRAASAAMAMSKSSITQLTAVIAFPFIQPVAFRLSCQVAGEAGRAALSATFFSGDPHWRQKLSPLILRVPQRVQKTGACP